MKIFLPGVVALCAVYPGVQAAELPVAATPSRAQAPDGAYIHWLERRIDDEGSAGLPLRGADGFELADFDRDGVLDVAIMYEDSNHVRIAFGGANTAARSGAWQVVTLAQGDEVLEVEDGAVGDLNGDGWPDLLVANEGGSLLYLQNPGGADRASIRSGNWQRAAPAGVSGRGSWIRTYLADFNGDGILEAVAVNKGVTMPSGKGSMDVDPTPISWFSIGADPLDPAQWHEHELTRAVIPINATPVDLDGDGDLDIVAGSRGEQRLIWFENTTPSAGADIRFVEHAVDVTGRHVPRLPMPGALSGFALAFTDVDGDGRLDIITSETVFSLVWLQQPERPELPWHIHSIGVSFPDTISGTVIADIDGDGRQDIVTGGYSADPRDHDDPGATRNSRAGHITWFQQPQNPTHPWVAHPIVRRVRGMYDAFAFVDIDGDGLGDVLATRGNSGGYDGLFWLQQARSPAPRPALVPARVVDSRGLPPASGALTRIVRWLLQ